MRLTIPATATAQETLDATRAAIRHIREQHRTRIVPKQSQQQVELAAMDTIIRFLDQAEVEG